MSVSPPPLHELTTEDQKESGPSKWLSTRFLLCYMASAGLCVVGMQNVALSMAVVCMVNHTAVVEQRHHHAARHPGEFPKNVTHISTIDVDSVHASTDNYTFHRPHSATAKSETNDTSVSFTAQRCERSSSDAASKEEKEDGPFTWSKQIQGLLLAAIYVGYTAMQIPGSYILHRLGVRVISTSSVMAMSVCHVLCHPAAFLSPWAVILLRVVMGVCAAHTIPAFYGIWGRWSPRAEQATLLGITFAGQTLANVIVFPLSALLCQHGFLGGWPSIFYVFGGLGIVWAVAWFFLMTNSPETHPRIKPAERDYIMLTRASVTDKKKKLKVPWRDMLTSSCFWAIAVVHFVNNWGFFLLLATLPTFLYEVMGFDTGSNGLVSMLPYIALFLTQSSTGVPADWLVKRRLLSVLVVRKLFTAVALVSPAVLLVVMSHLGCDQTTAVVALLVLSVGVTGLAMTGGFFTNPYDVAPRHATSMLTTTNTMAAFSGMVGPYVVAAVTVDQTREEWQTVFYITAGLYLFGTLIFCVFAKGHVQSWDRPPEHEMEIEVTEKADTEKLDI